MLFTIFEMISKNLLSFLPKMFNLNKNVNVFNFHLRIMESFESMTTLHDPKQGNLS